MNVMQANQCNTSAFNVEQEGVGIKILFSRTRYDHSWKYHPFEDRTVVLAADLQTTYRMAEMPGRRIVMEDAMFEEVWDREKFSSGVTATRKVTVSFVGCPLCRDSATVTTK
ncbi:hypothetical protein IV203_009233 [Nitzschia inconspicua]|uniref:Uncharacterized protein n=1 Tax=Nitzschia inconspicua TaxID=303405 RepID=A0A9K3L121_9STRA|nr:hypothetical protein IV203_011040 [Nitzschia inconspicua]KAG7353184.1 hypothetical protein IV203_009233 [Nitzschia inconspicua]